MTPSLVSAFVWLLTANIMGMLPSRDNHWFRAYVLIVCGVPLLGWVWWQNGWTVSALFFAAAASVLRWPLRYLLAWASRVAGITPVLRTDGSGAGDTITKTECPDR